MLTLVTRLMARSGLLAGLLSALLWVALPAVAAAWPKAHQTASESAPCSCCDGQVAIGGGIACVACQVAAAGAAAPTTPLLPVAAAWLSSASAALAGMDAAPTDPPPRPFRR